MPHCDKSVHAVFDLLHNYIRIPHIDKFYKACRVQTC